MLSSKILMQKNQKAKRIIPSVMFGAIKIPAARIRVYKSNAKLVSVGFGIKSGEERFNHNQAAAKPIQTKHRVSIAHLGSSLGATKGNTLMFIIKGKASRGAINTNQDE
jgi:hypothetical protein